MMARERNLARGGRKRKRGTSNASRMEKCKGGGRKTRRLRRTGPRTNCGYQNRNEKTKKKKWDDMGFKGKQVVEQKTVFSSRGGSSLPTASISSDSLASTITACYAIPPYQPRSRGGVIAHTLTESSQVFCVDPVAARQNPLFRL